MKLELFLNLYKQSLLDVLETYNEDDMSEGRGPENPMVLLDFITLRTQQVIDFLDRVKGNISHRHAVAAVEEHIAEQLSRYLSAQQMEVNFLGTNPEIYLNVKDTSGHFLLLAIEKEMITALKALRDGYKLPEHLDQNVVNYYIGLNTFWVAALVAATLAICLSPVSWLVFIPAIVGAAACLALTTTILSSQNIVKSYDDMLSSYEPIELMDADVEESLRAERQINDFGDRRIVHHMTHITNQRGVTSAGNLFFHHSSDDEHQSLSDKVDDACRYKLSQAGLH